MKSISSYVLLTCDVGKRDFVKKELESFNEIKEIVGTYGMYDIILKIESESEEKIQSFVRDKIRNVDHIRTSLTLSLPEWGSITFAKK
ncbi:MAG: Lrp/AsnC ligand binding domain-containing protein [Nitrosopumilaceae archaeon]